MLEYSVFEKNNSHAVLTDFAITVCDGCGGFKWRWLERPDCAPDCFEKHEVAHIEWFTQKRPNACKGRSPNSNPGLQGSDTPCTECYAYGVSVPCLEKARLRSRFGSGSCNYFLDKNLESQK